MFILVWNEVSWVAQSVSFWAGITKRFRSSATDRLAVTKAELEPCGTRSLALAVATTYHVPRTSQTFDLLQQPWKVGAAMCSSLQGLGESPDNLRKISSLITFSSHLKRT